MTVLQTAQCNIDQVSCELKEEAYGKKGRQDRDGTRERNDLSLLTPTTPSHKPYIVASLAGQHPLNPRTRGGLVDCLTSTASILQEFLQD